MNFESNIIRKHSLCPIPLVWLKVGELETIVIYDDMTMMPESERIHPRGNLKNWQWLEVNDGQINVWRKMEADGKVYGPIKVEPFARFEATKYGWEAALAFHKYMDKTFVNRVCDRDLDYRKANGKA